MREKDMDIKKLNNNINAQLNGTGAAGHSAKASEAANNKAARPTTDKVSLGDYRFSKNEKLFAKIELEKLNQSSFGKLKEYKAKLQEYQEAKEVSPEKAGATEIGKMLNDPEIWSQIADKMTE